MKTAAVFLSVLSVATASRHAELFTSFKTEHNKVYATDEEELSRFEVFVKNLVVSYFLCDYI